MKEINFDHNVVFLFLLYSDSFRFGDFSLDYIIRRIIRITTQDHTKMVQVLAGYDCSKFKVYI